MASGLLELARIFAGVQFVCCFDGAEFVRLVWFRLAAERLSLRFHYCVGFNDCYDCALHEDLDVTASSYFLIEQLTTR